MTDPNPHGCTIGGQPAMPILISEYNQLAADLAASVAAGEQQKRRADQAEELLSIAHDTSNQSEAARARAAATVDRVRALHTRALRMEALVCAHCGTAWPCPTTQTLDQTAPSAALTAELETTARVFSALHRSAEADVTRIIDLYERWVKAGPPPLGTSMSRWWDARLAELHNAIRPPADQPTEK